MKKLCVLLAVTMLTCVCVPVQAQERQLLRIAVPFSFTAENTNLPAGSYSVYLLNPFNLVRVQSADGRNVAIIRGMPAPKLSEAKLTQLVFDRIDGQYFLAEIREQGSNMQRELPLGTRARELAKNHNIQPTATTVTISAR